MDKLADPAVQGDSKEFQKVSKAMGALQDVVHTYQKYKECLQGSEEAKAMAKEAPETTRWLPWQRKRRIV